MVVAGIMLGDAVIWTNVLPRWTGVTLIAGMVFMTASTGLPDAVRTMSAGVRDLAFAAMVHRCFAGHVFMSIVSDHLRNSCR
jgi:hypothetical protein